MIKSASYLNGISSAVCSLSNQYSQKEKVGIHISKQDLSRILEEKQESVNWKEKKSAFGMQTATLVQYKLITVSAPSVLSSKYLEYCT